MGRQPCCDKVGLKKGPWTAEEDKKLINFILNNGQCCWRAVPKLAGPCPTHFIYYSFFCPSSQILLASNIILILLCTGNGGGAGLLRCGKSCRLRWTNYLRPDLKRGLLSESEEKLVIDLHSRLGNRLVSIVSC